MSSRNARVWGLAVSAIAATAVLGPAAATADPTFGVMNASGGIYWRSAPDWNTPVAVAGNGFYPNTTIAVHCYQSGAGNVPGSADTMWEQASVVSGSGTGSGWINEHFINDGAAINQPSPGVPPCNAPPAPAPPPAPTPAPAPTPTAGNLVFPVYNADGGIYYRNSPNQGDTSQTPGVGVYNGDQVKLICGQFGGAGPNGNTAWSYVQNLTRPSIGNGWVNEHFINDGAAFNALPGGEPTCGSDVPGASGTSTTAPPPAPGPPVPPRSPDTYAALGDSYSSGEGVPPFINGTDVASGDQCHRSTRAYAERLRGTRGFPSILVRAACSGATIANFYPGQGQRGETQGELSALGRYDSLVTLTAGGNDVKFSTIIKSCVVLSACYLGLDTPTRLLISHTVGRLKDLYRRILSGASNAQVYVLGYPDFFSPHPSLLCNGIDVVEARWMTKMEGLLNSGIQSTISNLRIPRLHFVDTATAFAGGELCSSKTPVYMNGIISAHTVYSFHPTAAGQGQLASRLARAVPGG